MKWNKLVLIVLIVALCACLLFACDALNANDNPDDSVLAPPPTVDPNTETTFEVTSGQWLKATNRNDRGFDGCIASITETKGDVLQREGTIKKQENVFAETWIDKQNNDNKTVLIWNEGYSYVYVESEDQYFANVAQEYEVPSFWRYIEDGFSKFTYNSEEHFYSSDNVVLSEYETASQIKVWFANNKRLEKVTFTNEDYVLNIVFSYDNAYTIDVPTVFNFSEDLKFNILTVNGKQEIAVTGVTNPNIIELTIPSYVTAISMEALGNLHYLEKITLSENIKYIGEYAFRDDRALTSIELPEGITTIEYATFSGCSKLENINIPNSVTKIKERAFEGAGLKSIYIHKDITEIGDAAFAYTNNVTEIAVDPENTVYDSRNDCNAIINTSTNTLIAGCKNTVIPNDVVKIGHLAFSFIKGLTTLVIPESVKTIDNYAFSQSGLQSVTLPASLETIGNGAFEYSKLSAISIPKNVTIGKNAFQGNPLQTIQVDAENEKYDSRNDCNALIETETNVLLLGSTSTIIPNTVVAIGERAFSQSTITSLVIPSSVKEIKGSAFVDCKQLTSITLNSGLETIGEQAFLCSGLTSVTISDTVMSIGNDAFNGCKELETVVLPASLQTIGKRAFYESGITSIVIPSGIKEIAEMAFASCKNLTSVTLNSGLETIGQMAFTNSGLTSITLSDTITTIEYGAFTSCSNLEEVYLPVSLETIGGYAFFRCGELETINYDGTKAEWEEVTKAKNWVFAKADSQIKYEDGTTEPLYDAATYESYMLIYGA